MNVICAISKSRHEAGIGREGLHTIKVDTLFNTKLYAMRIYNTQERKIHIY